MIKNIVFDIGDVLVNYAPERYVKEIGMSVKKVNQANDILVKDKKWRDYLNGDIELSEILLYFKKEYNELEKEFEVVLLKEHHKKMISEIVENTNLLKQLAIKYDIYLLSNITKETFECIQETFDFVKYIKGGIYSYQEHISKPDKKIYEKLIRKYQLKPEETIYIDDRRKNVEIANELGMIGIQYEPKISLEEKLGGYLN